MRFPTWWNNAESPDREKVRATLRAFAAFKLTSPEYFSSHGRFLTAQGKLTADNIACDGWLQVMGKADFRTLHTWVKKIITSGLGSCSSKPHYCFSRAAVSR